MILEKYPKMKIVRPMLTYEDGILFDIYNRVIDPTNMSIDWIAYFVWAYVMEVENIEDSADLLLTIRTARSEHMRNKDDRKKDIEQRQKVQDDLLKRKFGG